MQSSLCHQYFRAKTLPERGRAVAGKNIALITVPLAVRQSDIMQSSDFQ